MILGIGLRNYKVYKTQQYIPISSGQRFSAFLGPNGIGKTSIFEALDRFFNGGEWIISNESKKSSDDSAYVSPLFLIPINEISLNKKEKRLAALISSYFWEYSESPYDPLIGAVIDNRAAATNAGYNKESHYFFMLGSIYQTNEIKIPFFENGIAKLFEQHSDVYFGDLSELLKKIKSHYRFIYLPAEADSLSFSRMESIYIKNFSTKILRKKFKTQSAKIALTK
ncbi:MAG: AAA family ATPase [Polaromonas sp.]